MKKSSLRSWRNFFLVMLVTIGAAFSGCSAPIRNFGPPRDNTTFALTAPTTDGRTACVTGRLQVRTRATGAFVAEEPTDCNKASLTMFLQDGDYTVAPVPGYTCSIDGEDTPCLYVGPPSGVPFTISEGANTSVELPFKVGGDVIVVVGGTVTVLIDPIVPECGPNREVCDEDEVCTSAPAGTPFECRPMCVPPSTEECAEGDICQQVATELPGSGGEGGQGGAGGAGGNAGSDLEEIPGVCIPGGGEGGQGGAGGQGGSGGDAGDAGAGGQSGSGGNGGDGGTSGDGGSGGDAGSSGDGGLAGNAGAGGDAGASGSGGDAGDGGTSGDGGVSGEAGMAGAGGVAGNGGSSGASGDAGSGASGGAGGEPSIPLPEGCGTVGNCYRFTTWFDKPSQYAGAYTWVKEPEPAKTICEFGSVGFDGSVVCYASFTSLPVVNTFIHGSGLPLGDPQPACYGTGISCNLGQPGYPECLVEYQAFEVAQLCDDGEFHVCDYNRRTNNGGGCDFKTLEDCCD